MPAIRRAQADSQSHDCVVGRRHLRDATVGVRSLARVTDLTIDRSRAPALPGRRTLLAALAAAAVLPALGRRAGAQSEGLAERTVDYPVAGGRCAGLLVHQAALAKMPAIVVVPETSGAVSCTRLARRLARQGYMVFVPSFVTLYGSPDDKAARTKLNNLTPANVTALIRSAIDFLAAQPQSSGTVALVALGWGAAGCAAIAADPGPVKALVLFYMAPPTGEQIPAIKVPLQLHYAALDERTMALVEPAERKLMGHSKVYEQYVYEGQTASFMNEQTDRKVDDAVVALAFDRMEFFLARYVKPR
ncbi:hypothetical protein C2U72_17115 [Prosthecomicrobium hirschii]|nr:hypothetical protein C2U72_17115 [Prosthecomicrobium hirschii]